MLQLLRRVRDERRAGKPIDVFLFDLPAGSDTAKRDERMAATLLDHVRRAPEDVFVIEVGNYHAKTTPGAPWNASQRWMGTYLKQPGVRLVSLDVRGEPGTVWVCIYDRQRSAQSCGPRESKSTANTSGTSAARRIELQPALDGYDGIFTVGPFTASPPAFNDLPARVSSDARASGLTTRE